MKDAITYIDEVSIKNKRILLRADFDVSLNPNHTIANDARIRSNIPTITYLLKQNNRLICIAKLGRPQGRDKNFSLKIVVHRLQQYLPHNTITLVDDFRKNPEVFLKQKNNQILVLENIRFYPEEKTNDPQFAKQLASLGDIYVNDAFAMSHRSEASVVGVPDYIPSYGGLLLKKEVETIGKAIKNPKKPFVAIMGGAKISSKIPLIGKLTEIADHVLIGGGLANTFLCAEGYQIGKSFCEYEKVSKAKQLMEHAKKHNTAIILPVDVVTGKSTDTMSKGIVRKVNEIPKGAEILDIGPETQAKFGALISRAKTIIWNGPVGYFENPVYRQGTDFVYYAITENHEATSIAGGGDTLSAISKEEYLDKVTHISTGGGAMLEYIEKGTLPGLEALKH